MRARPNNTNRLAFTLIELLVVVAVIALLIGILAPSLNRARQKAIQIHCLANMGELSRGMLIYAHSNRWRLPSTRQQIVNQDDEPETKIWTVFLQPVLRSEKVFLCPAAGDSRFTTEWDQRGWLSIGLNRKLDPKRNQDHQIDDITRTSWTVLLADSVYGSPDPPDSLRGFMVQPGRAGCVNQRERIADRHNGQTNVAFVDGHAEHFPGVEIDGVDNAKENHGLLWLPPW